MGQKFVFEGKAYDSDDYYIGYNGSEKAVYKKNKNATASDKNVNVNTDEVVANTGDEKANNQADKRAGWNNFKQGVGNAMQGAGRAAAYAGAATAKAQGINDPQAGHYAQQAALSEAQAAKIRADEQLARQEAYRNSGDRALTESAKMAEASSAANIRNNQKAMSAEMGGAAATMSAQKNANVDPMQNAMALKQQGYNRQDTATQLGQQAATYQSGAEAQRANATESGELARQNAIANEEKKRAAQAQAERDEYARNLQNQKTQEEINKLQKETSNIESSTQKTNVENAQAQYDTTRSMSSSKDKLDYALNVGNFDQKNMTNLFWDWNEYAKEDGKAAEAYMDNIIIPRIGKGSEAARYIYSAWQRANQGTPNYDNANRIMYDRLISDERMKNILSPAGRTLLHIYKGRTR